MDADSNCNQTIYLNGTNPNSPTVYNLTTTIGHDPYDTLSSDVFRIVGESRDGTIFHYFGSTQAHYRWAFYNPSVNSVYFQDFTYRAGANFYGTFFDFYFNDLDVLSIKNVFFDGTGSYYVVHSYPTMNVRGINNIIMEDFYLENVTSSAIFWTWQSSYVTLRNVHWRGNPQV